METDRRFNRITATPAGDIPGETTTTTCSMNGSSCMEWKPPHQVKEEGRKSTSRPFCTFRCGVTFINGPIEEIVVIIKNKY